MNKQITSEFIMKCLAKYNFPQISDEQDLRDYCELILALENVKTSRDQYSKELQEVFWSNDAQEMKSITEKIQLLIVDIWDFKLVEENSKQPKDQFEKKKVFDQKEIDKNKIQQIKLASMAAAQSVQDKFSKLKNTQVKVIKSVQNLHQPGEAIQDKNQQFKGNIETEINETKIEVQNKKQIENQSLEELNLKNKNEDLIGKNNTKEQTIQNQKKLSIFERIKKKPIKFKTEIPEATKLISKDKVEKKQESQAQNQQEQQMTMPMPIQMLPTVAPIEQMCQLMQTMQQQMQNTLQISLQTNEKKNERCKYWPNCKTGKSCTYFHPSEPCKNFPNCSYGSSCLYIHPAIPCKYGAWCQRPNCAYQHPREINNQQMHYSSVYPKQFYKYPLPQKYVKIEKLQKIPIQAQSKQTTQAKDIAKAKVKIQNKISKKQEVINKKNEANNIK